MHRFPKNVSSAASVMVNLIPLGGVLFFGWDVFQIVALYWFENLVLGGINVLKLLTCFPDPEVVDDTRKRSAAFKAQPEDMPVHLRGSSPGNISNMNQAAKIFLVPFFIIHYGIFCLVHGLFVFSLLGSGGMTGGPFAAFGQMIPEALAGGGKWFAAALVVSHIFAYFSEYLVGGEYRRTTLPKLMAAPYGRIVVLHVAILFGAFVILALGSPVFLLAILVIGKIFLDIKLHKMKLRKTT